MKGIEFYLLICISFCLVDSLFLGRLFIGVDVFLRVFFILYGLIGIFLVCRYMKEF